MGNNVNRVGFSWRIGSIKLSNSSCSVSSNLDFPFITGELKGDFVFKDSIVILKPEKRDISILHHLNTHNYYQFYLHISRLYHDYITIINTKKSI